MKLLLLDPEGKRKSSTSSILLLKPVLPATELPDCRALRGNQFIFESKILDAAMQRRVAQECSSLLRHVLLCSFSVCSSCPSDDHDDVSNIYATTRRSCKGGRGWGIAVEGGGVLVLPPTSG